MDTTPRVPKHGPYYNAMKHIVSELTKDASSWPFLTPVDIEAVTDYYSYIKDPMGESSMCHSFEEFIHFSKTDFLCFFYQPRFGDVGIECGCRRVQDAGRVCRRLQKDFRQLSHLQRGRNTLRQMRQQAGKGFQGQAEGVERGVKANKQSTS